MTQSPLIKAMTSTFETFCSANPYVTKSDFYECDIQTVNFHAVPGIEMLWVLNPYGTHLSVLNLHPRGNQAALATLDCAKGAGYDFQCLYIYNGNLSSVTERAARDKLRKPAYATHLGHVTRLSDQSSIAHIKLTLLDYNYHTDIEITSNSQRPLSLMDLIALYRIGIHEAEAYAHSLWIKPKAFTIDGADLYDLILQRKQKDSSLPVAA